MREWNPLTAILFVLTVNTLCSLTFIQAGMSLKWKRLLVALPVAGCLQYAAFFILSGFGWGWPEKDVRALLLARIGVGATVGIATTVFAWIMSRRWSLCIALVVPALTVLIFAPDPAGHLALQLLFSGAVMALGSYFWYRSRIPQNSKLVEP